MRRLVLLAILLFLLPVSCKLITASLFPAYLSQALASADFSDLLSSEDLENVDLTLLDNGLWEILFLTVPNFSGGSGERLVLIDGEDLEVMGEWTTQELNAFLPAPPEPGRFERLRLVDTWGRFVVGNFAFDGLTLQPIEKAGSAIDPNTVGFVGFSYFGFPPDFLSYALRVDHGDPPRLHIDAWDFFGGVFFFDYDLLFMGTPYGDLELLAGFYVDDDGTGDTFVLVFREDGKTRIQAIKRGPPVPPNDFPDSLSQPVLADTVNPVHLDLPRADVFRATADGFLLDTDDGLWQRYNYDGKKLDEFRVSDSGDETVADFSQQGEVFYLLDKRQTRLYKLRTWW